MSHKTLALLRFQLLRPFLEDGILLTEISRNNGIPLRTIRRWVQRYRLDGIAGLGRRSQSTKPRRTFESIEAIIEGFAFKKPRLSIAMIHRHVAVLAKKQKRPVPSYSSVYRIVQRLSPALMTLAHDGSKVYSETFDLIHRTDAEEANAIWQADHTLLDIWVLDGHGKSRKPWLTIILDDFSRAVAGFFLSFSAPSAIQTALALRQAIWRKPQSGWHVCGIPQVLYTDHGSDFTSQHIEQVLAELKIRLIFSAVGKPRGRGKIERFFGSLNQTFLSRYPGYSKPGAMTKAVLTLPTLAKELETYLIHEYNVTPHSATKQPPQARWESGGFLPQMPASLELLDLLLMTAVKARRVNQDRIQFMGMRYIDPTLAAYVGETVLIRYDPRDVAEIRVFFNDKYLCRAICQEIAGEVVALKEIMSARNRRRRELRQTVKDRRNAVNSLMEAKQWNPPMEETPELPPYQPSSKLKRYLHD